jgi:hypothetical protein
MKSQTNESQELIDQINNDYFTEEELDFLIVFAKELINSRT